MKAFFFTMVLLCAGFAGCGESQTPVVETSHPKYKPGQVWKYKTRPAEQQSRAVILRVDRSPKTGFIVHVALHDVALKSPSNRDGVAREIAHLPFSEQAVDQSVMGVERVGPVPDFSGGYRTWRAAFDQQKAGVWSTSLSEAVDAMEAVLNQK